MKTICRRLPAASLAALLAASPLAAQDEDALCEERSSSEIIHVAVCREAASDAELAEQGRRICGEDLPCGVWFWLDEDDIPDDAPENHDGLTQAEVTSSMGVFVAEREMFIRIEQVTE
jgi:hypothetical protein